MQELPLSLFFGKPRTTFRLCHEIQVQNRQEYRTSDLRSRRPPVARVPSADQKQNNGAPLRVQTFSLEICLSHPWKYCWLVRYKLREQVSTVACPGI